jgi:hypothetical protein
MPNVEDNTREASAPTYPLVVEVTMNADPNAWTTLTPPAEFQGASYYLLIEGTSAAYELTFKPSPASGDKGIRIPANTPLNPTPRLATPTYAGARCGWPSVRAASSFALRMMLFPTVP